MTTKLRILALGYIVRGPVGGLAWHHLQYVLGLARLGHDVYFLEDSDDYPGCYNPLTDEMVADPSYGLQFAREAFDRLGLSERWAYYDAHTTQWLGPCAGNAPGLCASAELLLNLSGMNPIRPWLAGIPARALVDTDPLFTQIRHLNEPDRRELARCHTSFFTFGENIAPGRSAVPDDGLPWRSTRQPLVMDAWPVTKGPVTGKLTTVMQWDSYRSREYGGVRYGMKSDSFLPYIGLPERAGPVFELALGGPDESRAQLRSKGWHVLDARGPTRDPWIYQDYIRRSKAEFSIAKQGYVTARTGWFSERSAAYLASGRPVVVQETGFSDWLKTGAGVLAFDSPEQAAGAIEEINARYEFHCRSAREMAEEFFDARKVLPGLIDAAMRPLSRP